MFIMELIFIWRLDPNQPAIYSVPVQSGSLKYEQYIEDADPEALQAVANLEEAAAVRYTVPAESSMRPVRMEVHDRSDVRGEVKARICLLGSNRTTWRAFTI